MWLSLHVNIKYRNEVINQDIMERIRDIFSNVPGKWGCELSEFGAEDDHVHLLIEAHTSLNLSRLIGNLKTVSARHIRKEYSEHVGKYFWKPYFWSRAYAITTTGGANLDKVKDYVLSQEKASAWTSDSFKESSRRMRLTFVQLVLLD